jgi:hypothetical protein
MAGLVPAIHVFAVGGVRDVDARHKAGHDELKQACFGLRQRIAMGLMILCTAPVIFGAPSTNRNS